MHKRGGNTGYYPAAQREQNTDALEEQPTLAEQHLFMQRTYHKTFVTGPIADLYAVLDKAEGVIDGYIQVALQKLGTEKGALFDLVDVFYVPVVMIGDDDIQFVALFGTVIAKPLTQPTRGPERRLVSRRDS